MVPSTQCHPLKWRFIDQRNPEYKGPWKQIHSMARVFTPEDRAIVSPNSDTPYSMLALDLRTEPMVLSVL